MSIQASGGRTSAATQEHMRRAAMRSARDHAKLAKAVRTVREAIRLGLIDRSEVATGGEQ
jgi:hypothetical protein